MCYPDSRHNSLCSSGPGLAGLDIEVDSGEVLVSLSDAGAGQGLENGVLQVHILGCNTGALLSLCGLHTYIQ